MEAVILEKISGCALFSKKYIAEAEKRIVNTDKNSVNFNSFFTDERALINNLSDLLSRPNLNTRVNLNKRSILKKRPSNKTNCFK